MLLPSALTCDSSQPRLQSALFISPPTSPQTFSTQSAIGNLINSCRNLHSLISQPAPHHLPSPPLAHAPSPARRLRRREAEAPRYRIKKRAAPPRGANKRRRPVEDDLGRSDDEVDEEDSSCGNQRGENMHMFGGGDERPDDDGVFVFRGAPPAVERSPRAAPSTPKRQRIAPPDVPMGLTREDFHKMGPSPQAAPRRASPLGTNVETDEHGDQWSLEDDSKLVEIVLEKVKNMDLSNEVWEDCVRNLPGRDYNMVSSRWKNLIRSERIGLQNRGRSRRARLHGTW